MNTSQLLAIAEDTVRLAGKKGASAAEAIVVESTAIQAGIRNGEPETIERAEDRGLGIRVFTGQSSATLSTSDLGKDAIIRMVEQALSIARAAPADPFAALADAALLARQFPDLDLAESEEPSMETLQDMAKRAEAAGMAVKGITNSEGADAGFGRGRTVLVTSGGFSGVAESTHSSVSVSLIAGEGDSMQRDYAYDVAVYRSDLDTPEDIGKEAAKRTLERMKPRKLSSQQVAVFFEPRVSKSLLGALAGAISGAAIARGTSFLKDELGNKIFSDTITIIDDPLIKRGLGSQSFDDEGVTASKRNFIENGILTSWILDTRSANQLKMKTTGHAARGLSSAPSPATSNFYLAAGKSSPEELLKSVKSGLLVTETIGHGANLITGDYSLGASGFWIENGEIAYPVSEITIASNLREMFATLVAANDLEFRYGTNAPTLMVPTMTLAGS